MVIDHISDKEDWNEYVSAGVGAHSSFLHSWEWLNMLELYGRPVYRLSLRQEGEPDRLGVVALVVVPLARGASYLFSPRGPVVVNNVDPAQMELFTNSSTFRSIAQRHRALFWRLEPPVHIGPSFARVADVEPSVTRMLHLGGSEEELLSSMKQKTRYNVRLAQKKGVEVEMLSSATHPGWAAAMDSWNVLLEETSTRHGIRHHPPAYYRHMISSLSEQGVLHIAVASHNGAVLAMNLLVRFGDTCTYVHGVSTQQHRELMAPYLLQWESILFAQQDGAQWYDMFGVAPHGDTQHRLAGVSRFKEGFGGSVYEYPGTFEFAIQPLWYKIYRAVKRVRTFI